MRLQWAPSLAQCWFVPAISESGTGWIKLFSEAVEGTAPVVFQDSQGWRGRGRRMLGPHLGTVLANRAPDLLLGPGLSFLRGCSLPVMLEWKVWREVWRSRKPASCKYASARWVGFSPGLPTAPGIESMERQS